MFLQIDDFLTAAEVRSIAELARQAKFIDGRGTNVLHSAKVNAMSDPADSLAQKAAAIAMGAIQRSQQAMDFAMPRRVAVPALCRYGVGMKYGAHVDAAFLPIDAQPLRSDVSCTIFISDPASYEGGVLTSHLGSETICAKGKPGSAVFYPSTTLHEVTPVTAGERLVLITFIESQVPDQLQRDLIYALNAVHVSEGRKMDGRNRMHLEYALSNLLRMWSR